MPRRIQCLVLMPVGPKSKPEYVEDTIESFRHHMSSGGAAMLVLDDSGKGVLPARLRGMDDVRCLPAGEVFPDPGRRYCTHGVLFAKQVAALDAVTREHDWECLMRLDDDALILGPQPHRDALAVFARRPEVGMLGAHLRRGDGTDKRRAMAQKGRLIVRQALSLGALRHPELLRLVVALSVAAKRSGYRLGDMCTGGSFFLSRAAYDGFGRFWRNGAASFRYSFLDDDLLFALHTAAAGYRISDFPEDTDILAVNWRGLPMPPEELVRRGKKVVHPVKDLDDPAKERDVRSFFRDRRALERRSA